MNFFQYFTYVQAGASALRDIRGDTVMDPLTRANSGDAVMATFSLCCMIGRDEAGASGGKQSFLQSHTHVPNLIAEIFTAALDGGIGPAYERMLKLWGYGFSWFRIPQITNALRVLSLSEANKGLLIANKNILPLILRVLRSFANNSPPCTKEVSMGVGMGYTIASVGGGGRDLPSASDALETLVQLAFFYESDEDLKNKFLIPELGVESLLVIISELPATFELSVASKGLALGLYRRLVPPKVVAMPPPSIVAPGSSPIKSKKHVMISYAWGYKKDYVLKFVSKLRGLGYDVWRDEDGSNIHGKLAGDIDESMAQAIDKAHTVIVFVSTSYKDSANCRAEASYCKLRRKTGLNVKFVMLDQNYTTVSTNTVDGWLGIMIGLDLWSAMWDEKMIDGTVSSFAKDITESQGVKADTSIVESIAEKTVVAASPAGPAPRDLAKAWTCLQSSNSENVKKLLVEYDVSCAQVLDDLETDELMILANELGKATKRGFLKALNLKDL